MSATNHHLIRPKTPTAASTNARAANKTSNNEWNRRAASDWPNSAATVLTFVTAGHGIERTNFGPDRAGQRDWVAVRRLP
jgi:hypothetical protein